MHRGRSVGLWDGVTGEQRQRLGCGHRPRELGLRGAACGAGVRGGLAEGLYAVAFQHRSAAARLRAANVKPRYAAAGAAPLAARELWPMSVASYWP